MLLMFNFSGLMTNARGRNAADEIKDKILLARMRALYASEKNKSF